MTRVGEIVHFYTSFPSFQSGDRGEGPYAAIVTAADESDKINVTVFRDGGTPFPVQSVFRGGSQSGLQAWWQQPS